MTIFFLANAFTQPAGLKALKNVGLKNSSARLLSDAAKPAQTPRLGGGASGFLPQPWSLEQIWNKFC